MDKHKKKVVKVAGPNPANIRKEQMAELIEKKKECEKKAHEIVLRLIEPSVDKQYLIDNALKISRHHLEDVIEERKLADICGWTLCDNKIGVDKLPKKIYHITKDRQVLNISERKAYCSGKCYAKSTHFRGQLLTSPLWLREIEGDVKFEVLEDDKAINLEGVQVPLTLKVDEDDDEEEKERASDDE